MGMYNDRTGELNVNKYGTIMKIIYYNNAHDIIVEFQDEYKYKVHTEYRNFKIGQVRNVYDKTVYDVGMFGEGKYNRVDYLKLYNTWQHMLRRCYDPYTINNDLTYVDCFVDKRFHNLQNFGIWYEKEFYEVNNELMCLDKDILYKGNKIYSPETCLFVPERINKLFIRNYRQRNDLPIGVHYRKDIGKYIARCNVSENGAEKRVYLGEFKTPIEAFNVYKKYKEGYIKIIADQYKNRIPEKVYKALYDYIVEICD